MLGILIEGFFDGYEQEGNLEAGFVPTSLTSETTGYGQKIDAHEEDVEDALVRIKTSPQPNLSGSEGDEWMCVEGVCDKSSVDCFGKCFPHTRRDGQCHPIDIALLTNPDRIGHVFPSLSDCIQRENRSTLNSISRTCARTVDMFIRHVLDGAKLVVVAHQPFIKTVEPRLPAVYLLSGNGFETEDTRTSRQYFEFGTTISLERIGSEFVLQPEYDSSDLLAFDQEDWILRMLNGHDVILRDTTTNHRYFARYVPNASTEEYVSYFRRLLISLTDADRVESRLLDSIGSESMVSLEQILDRRKSLLSSARRKLREEGEGERSTSRRRQRRRESMLSRRALASVLDSAIEEGERSLSVARREKDALRLQTRLIRDEAREEGGEANERLGLLDALEAIDDQMRQVDSVIFFLTQAEGRMRSRVGDLRQAATASTLIRLIGGERVDFAERMTRVRREYDRRFEEEERRSALRQRTSEESYCERLRRKEEEMLLKEAIAEEELQATRKMADTLLAREMEEDEERMEALRDETRVAIEGEETRRDEEVRSLAERHEGEMSEMRSAFSSLINAPVDIKLRDELKRFATTYVCSSCGTETVRLDEVALPGCDCTHGLCKECFLNHTRYVLENDQPKRVEDACLPCYKDRFEGAGCGGRYSFAKAVTCCKAVLQTTEAKVPSSSSSFASSSSSSSDPLPLSLPLSFADLLDVWRLATHQREVREQVLDLLRRESIDKEERRETLRRVMRDNGWNPNSRNANMVYQCPRCSYGPIIRNNCYDLGAHHNEQRPGEGRASNACPRCNFFSTVASNWDPWDGTVDDSFLSDA